MTELPATQSRQKKLVAFGALTVAVSYGMARFALGLTTPRIVEDQIVTEAHIGYASSLSFFTYVIACFISGALLKRGQWKISIFAVLVTAGVGSLLVAISTSALNFMAGIGVAGAAAGFTSGGYSPPAHQGSFTPLGISRPGYCQCRNRCGSCTRNRTLAGYL
ncbi:hypothetical protein [uncultured Rothia sp.]|uniref:hypothetical protein n=1 Tax=uncultured Rothia sp. TaxID=316088 RepID=UPI0032178498